MRYFLKKNVMNFFGEKIYVKELYVLLVLFFYWNSILVLVLLNSLEIFFFKLLKLGLFLKDIFCIFGFMVDIRVIFIFIMVCYMCFCL